MKKDLTEIVFILDRSGSMAGLESDTIGGFNSMITKQKLVKGEAIISTVLFDDQFEVLHNRLNLNYISPITNKEYFVRGMTALIDAIGRCITKIKRIHSNLNDDEKPEKVIVIIITDGMENSSQEYSDEKVKQLIEEQKRTQGWEFIFLGANIDAVKTAQKVGISPNRSANYNSDSQGTNLNYKVMSNLISEYRSDKKINEDWKKQIDEDFQNRK